MQTHRDDRAAPLETSKAWSNDPFVAIHTALIETDPERKCRLVAQIEWPECMFMYPATPPAKDERIPGRPARPTLVRPRDVPYRGLGSAAGRIALIHAVAHIEFNAINLALDAAWRFRGMPSDYYREWLSVARDEARHFTLLRARLVQQGSDYGELTAHNGLWEAAEKTADDVLVRMCCVPRVLEARGLDVTPGIIRRLREVRDDETVAILELILEEEVGHVLIGTQWFHWCCERAGVDPLMTSQRLLKEQNLSIRLPINETARLAAGFSIEEIAVARAQGAVPEPALAIPDESPARS